MDTHGEKTGIFAKKGLWIGIGISLFILIAFILPTPQSLIKVLGKYEKYSIVIEGHTDSTGDEEYNLLLSKRRAASVGNYLIENGIDSNRLSYKGYGSKYPIDTNETEEGKERNRRVEFLLERK